MKVTYWLGPLGLYWHKVEDGGITHYVFKWWKFHAQINSRRVGR